VFQYSFHDFFISFYERDKTTSLRIYILYFNIFSGSYVFFFFLVCLCDLLIFFREFISKMYGLAVQNFVNP
jgi:hypothetical protein